MFARSKKRSPSANNAAEYLAALSDADRRARDRQAWPKNLRATPTSTPALSLSSSTTVEDDVTEDDMLTHPFTPPTSEQVFTTSHAEFGHCSNEDYRYTSQHDPTAPLANAEAVDPPYYILLSTYLSYLILICFGHLRDFVGKRMRSHAYTHLMQKDGYAPLNSDFDSFYTRRLKTRFDDCFSKPITLVPGRTVLLKERVSTNYNVTFTYTGNFQRVLNISSYNYLGFAQATGGCADAVEEGIRRYGIGSYGPRRDASTTDLHIQAELLVARFLGQEAAMISSMGFATNSTIIPALVGKGCLVISDELNHASIRFGVRLSGAHVRMFKHNDMRKLETLLRECISQGQPRTHRPWKKILVIVEGLYSMEGDFVDLPAVLELRDRYKFNLFVDEAHSIGAVGPHARGVADYFNIDPRRIDVQMGTFTKSFGAAGGYIAGSKSLVEALRLRSHSAVYSEAMTPAVLTQVVASMASLMGVSEQTNELYLSPAPPSMLPAWVNLPPALRSGEEGRMRLRRLAFNSRYLTFGLQKLGFIVYGHVDSPIVPAITFNPGKLAAFGRLMAQWRVPIVAVVVGYPATPLIESRVRFCVSAAHTKDDIDTVLQACDEIGDALDMKHGIPKHERWTGDEVTERAVELVNGQA